MTVTIAGITGVLLAGGRSRRMGRDKRFLDLEGMTLFQRVLGVMERVFSDILISVAEPFPEMDHLGYRIVTDLIPGCASLGGLYTGLFYAGNPRIFAVACDMPFLDSEVIRAMVEVDPQADVVMAQLSTGLQPMHAIYSKCCVSYFEAMAQDKNLKIQGIIGMKGLSVHLISEQDLQDKDPRMLSFLNVNTPADFEFARKLLAGQKNR